VRKLFETETVGQHV